MKTTAASGKTPHRFERVTFKTSREMDFFSEKELVTQTGHKADEWPLVIVKELVDNALDACEEADVPPIIDMQADACGISVKDNGPGLPEATLKGAMDFTIRASNREAYVSPCRGAQGNALKTLLPMPWVLDPNHGKLIVTTNGRRHVITCGADPISQRPVVHDDVAENVKTNGFHKREKACFLGGTEVRIEWGPSQCDGEHQWPFLETWGQPIQPLTSCDVAEGLFSLVEGFAAFNPHATITLNWFGTKTRWGATDHAWQKWKPHQPTSAHWYDVADLERLIAAYVTHDREMGTDRLVSDFVAEFDGLRGSAKRSHVLDDAGLRRAKLSDFVAGGRLDSGRIAALLHAMQKHTKPVNPKRLGIIGAEHMKKRLLDMGIVPESFTYTKKLGDPKSKNLQTDAHDKASLNALPWVLESAFGWLGKGSKDSRRIFTGANWSAAIKNPFRSFGSTGEGLETVLSDMRATRNEPVVVVLHLAQPRIRYTDRGKSALIVD